MQYRLETRPSYILYWLLVLLPIYQDSPMSKYLGAAGYSIITPLSFVIFLYIVIFKQKGVFQRQEETHRLFILGYLLLIVSFVGLLYWLLIGNPVYYVGEFLPVKAVKVSLLYFSYPIYVYAIISCGKTLRNKADLFLPVYFCLIIITLIAIIEKSQIPYAFRELHYSGVFPYYRIRLLTTESSYTALPIFVYSGLSIYYGLTYKKVFILISSVGCYLIQLILSGSKSLAITISLFILCYVLIALRSLNRKTIFSLVVVSVIFAVFAEKMLPRIVESAQNDLDNYSSIATRMYTALIGIFIGIVYPLGVGGAAYIGIFQAALNKHIGILDKLSINISKTEILNIANSNTDYAVTVKSGILQYNMYWGILGTIFLMNVFKEISRKIVKSNIQNHEILRSVFGATVIMLVISSNFQYEFWMMYAILGCLINKQETHSI